MLTYGNSTSAGQDESPDSQDAIMDAIAAVIATLTGPPFESDEMIRRSDESIRNLQSVIRDNASQLASTDREPWERIFSLLEQMRELLRDQSARIRTLEAQNHGLIARIEAADRRSKKTFAWGVLLGLPVGMIGTLLMWAIGIS